MDFESIEDVPYDGTAKDIAELAGMAIKSLEESTDPEYEFINNVYLNGLKSFHVIVTNTEEEFQYLSNDNTGDNVIAFTRSRLYCWDELRGEVNFDIVVKNTYSQDIFTLSHELSHIIAYYIYGDSDNDHVNENVWFELREWDSIQGKILREYESETGLNPL
jgi:hypothetical protein